MSYTLAVKSTRSILVAPGIACAMLLCGCNGVQVFQEQVVRTDDYLAVPGPFRPSVMRVHPLTHTELSAEGDPVLILHMELKDPWGDTVKGVGQLQVQVYQTGLGSAIGNQGTRWDIDLREIEANVSYFDSATRTYRFVIGGLPEWLSTQVRDFDADDVDGRIRALFRTSKADGEPVVLQDEYLLR
jgi:hypothetical protein